MESPASMEGGNPSVEEKKLPVKGEEGEQNQEEDQTTKKSMNLLMAALAPKISN